MRLCRQAWRNLVQHYSSDNTDGEANLIAEDRGHDEHEEVLSRVVVIFHGGAQSIERRLTTESCVLKVIRKASSQLLV